MDDEDCVATATDNAFGTVPLLGSGPPGVAPNTSRFDYTYDAEGQIATWAKQFSAAAALGGTYSYDAADQLTSATSASATAPANFAYAYDAAGNRTTDEQGTVAHRKSVV